MLSTSRRQFLGGVGKSAACVAVGLGFGRQPGLARALFASAQDRLRFGALDPLVDLLQASEADALLGLVVARLRSGTPLADIVAAAALANARGHGGTNYDGYHALMAMVPSLEMGAQMPEGLSALPVLKVVHRNARFLHAADRATSDALTPLVDVDCDATLVAMMRARDLPRAEQCLLDLEQGSHAQAFEQLQIGVREAVNVHRVVLAWRAHDLLRLTGADQSLTMLRQSLRFCIDEDSRRASRGGASDPIAELLPQLMEQHGLNARPRGARAADEATIERLAGAFFASDRVAAAEAAAQALASGLDPEDVGRALSLAGVRLLLHDPGQKRDEPGKPSGSVHGASVGVHASDAANAWQELARTGSAQNAFASLIVAAYHTAGQSEHVAAEPFDRGVQPCTLSERGELLAACEGRILERDQPGACAAARRYCELGHPPAALFALLLRFAVGDDGALHAEKFFRTAQAEHGRARAPHRALFVVALTRVTASQHGFEAPGVEEARRLLSA